MGEAERVKGRKERPPAPEAPTRRPSGNAVAPEVKTYDRAYFDHWYRRRRIRNRALLARKAAMVVSLTEHFLGRALRDVLDVGCGEAPWRAELKKLRPRVSYVGLDPSDYVVETFGRSHNVSRGSFGTLGTLGLARSFDLVLCCDVLHYLDEAEIRAGLGALPLLLDGVAYLEAFTAEDDAVGDLNGFRSRPASFYRTLFRSAGLLPFGPAAWVCQEMRDACPALEILA